MGNLKDDYLGIGKSATPSDKVLVGRPYGGIGCLWHKSLAHQISCVPVNSKRICAICLSGLGGSKILIVNVYFPCDNGLMTHTSTENEKCIETLEFLLKSLLYNDGHNRWGF